MSDGEPGSIKRNLMCAARQPAQSRLSGKRVYHIFKGRCAAFHRGKTGGNPKAGYIDPWVAKAFVER